MKPLEMLLKNAARSQKRIVLSEGTDPRVVRAAIEARKRGIAKIVLVGPREDILEQYSEAGAQPDDGVEIHDPLDSAICADLAQAKAGLDWAPQKDPIEAIEGYAAFLAGSNSR